MLLCPQDLASLFAWFAQIAIGDTLADLCSAALPRESNVASTCYYESIFSLSILICIFTTWRPVKNLWTLLGNRPAKSLHCKECINRLHRTIPYHNVKTKIKSIQITHKLTTYLRILRCTVQYTIQVEGSAVFFRHFAEWQSSWPGWIFVMA